MKRNYLNWDKEKEIKNEFLNYFDGNYGIEPEPNTSNTFTMGVCKLEYDKEANELTVHLRRPGLLIGKKGWIIDALTNHLECKIKVIEVDLLNS